MRFLLSLIALIVLSAGCIAGPPIPEQLVDNTVLIKVGYHNHGSGLLFTRQNASCDGDETFIWTVAHVVKHYMDADGFCRLVPFSQGDKLGLAEVLRMSDSERGDDLALLRVTEGEFCGTATFFRAFNEIKLGQRIIHCGTPFNPEWNERLVVYGRISCVNRKLASGPMDTPHEGDQVNATIYPGCSGGPVVDEDTGDVVGLADMGYRPGMGAMEPTRHIYQFAKDHDCLWAFDRSQLLPEYLTSWPSDLHVRLVKERPCMFDAEWGSSPQHPDPNERNLAHPVEPTLAPPETIEISPVDEGIEIIIDIGELIKEAQKAANDDPFEVPPLIVLPGQGPE